MGDVDGGDAELLLDAPDFRAHVYPQLGVQVAQRLVEQQHAGLHHQGPGQGHPLLLAAGELVCVPVFHALQAHQVQHVEHLFADLLLGQLAQLEAVGHVVEHVQVGEQGVALKHHGGIPLVGGQAVDGLVAQIDFPLVGAFKPGDHPQGSGFATAGGAQQGNKIPGGHGHVDGIHRLEFLIGLGVDIDLGHVFQAHAFFCVAHTAHSFSLTGRLPVP